MDHLVNTRNQHACCPHTSPALALDSAPLFTQFPLAVTSPAQWTGLLAERVCDEKAFGVFASSLRVPLSSSLAVAHGYPPGLVQQ